MVLTLEERRRFVEYLRQDAESNRLLLRQLEKIQMHELVQQKRQLIVAQLIVARELDVSEQQIIG